MPFTVRPLTEKLRQLVTQQRLPMMGEGEDDNNQITTNKPSSSSTYECDTGRYQRMAAP